MDFSFTEDQQGIRQLLKQVLGDLVTDESLKALKKEGKWFHERAWQQLGASEMLGLAIPEAYGGAGLGLVELCLLLHQVGRTAAPVPALHTLASAALPIAAFGTDAQKERWLPGAAGGEVILTAALCDQGTRDPLRPAATAERDHAVHSRDSDSTDGWRLSGAFTNVAYANRAACVLLAAEADDGAKVFLVDPAADGVTLAAQRGTNDEPLWLLTLDGARAGPDDVLGGADVLKYTIDRTLLGMCAIELGIAEKAMFMSATYTSERKQFGMPLAGFQAVRQRLADAYIDVQAMQATMWQACWRLEQGLDADKELAVAKYWAADGGARVVAAAQHVHGGMGFDRDYPLHRYFLTSKHLEFTLGGANEQLTRLGDLLAEG